MPVGDTTNPRIRPGKAGSTGTRLELSAAVKPVGNPQIVKVGDITGIFTPLTDKAKGPLSEDERKNFESLVDHLKDRINDLQSENLALSQQLEILRNPPRSAEDFATAVQQSVDELQQKLTTMKNPVSSFALKDFRLEANVMIDVSSLGIIEYRFIRPNDPVDPNSLSRINMEFVPIPKAGLDHTWTADMFQPGTPIQQLPYINEKQCGTLEANHVFTIGEFLQVGTRVRTATQIVALLGIQRAQLAAWLEQAELLTLKGTNGASVLVLIAAGFNSLEAIATASPEEILVAYLAKREEMNLAAAVQPTLELVTLWTTAARRYLGYNPAPA